MGEKNGFTFVELLATIVIIGILSIIAIVAVNSVIQSGKEKELASSENMMKLAAKQYYADNTSKRPKRIGETSVVNLKSLIEQNYIGDIYDSNKKICKETESKVYITKSSKTEYEYRAELVCGDGAASSSNTQSVNVIVSEIVNQSINIANVDKENNDIAVSFKITTPTGSALKSYYYEVYRNSKLDGTNWKLLKTSDNIQWSGNNKEENVTVKYKDTRNAEYRIVLYATNSTGITGKGSQRNLYVDTVAPTCSVTIPGENGSNGWFKTNVTVTFKGNDNINTAPDDGNNYMSGLAGSRLTTGGVGYDGPVLTRTANQGETPGIRWYGYVKDKAGNIGSCQVNRTFKVDTTSPRMWWNSGEGPYEDNSGINVSSGCADDRSSVVNSGVASQTGSSHIGSPAYAQNATHYCTDKAGNSTSTSREFYVKYYSTSSKCGAKTCTAPCCGYKTCTIASVCGYKTCTSASVCGYNSCSNSACGCASYITKSSCPNCGTGSRKMSYTSLTHEWKVGSGCPMYYKGNKCSKCSVNSVTNGTANAYCPVYSTVTHYFPYCKTCSVPANGCASYRTCATSACGARTCTAAGCGVATCTKPGCGNLTCTKGSCCGWKTCWHY